MNWPAQCLAVIPCLNEAATIGPLVARLREQLPAVIVVDDGSTDATAAEAARAGAQVLTHARTRGKGAALTAGLARAREQGFAWAVLLDGDGQHSPADLPGFFQAAERSGAALVVGNRMENPAGMPRVRRWVNQWMSRRLSCRAGRPLPDSQCGFRLLQLSAWAGLRLETSRFEIESEMLLAFVAAGLRVEFVPIEVIYQRERSKIRPLADTWRWFRWFWGGARRFQPGLATGPSSCALAGLEQDAGAEEQRDPGVGNAGLGGERPPLGHAKAARY